MSDLLELQASPQAFREALLIDTDHGPKPFAECIATNPWQASDFAAMDEGWKQAIGQPVDGTPKQRGWLERGRGHSKTLDLAVMASWALFASRRRLTGIGAAGDQDQARLLRDAIGRLVFVNPWLGKLLEVQANRVINPRTGSTLEIITSDAPSSYGLTPDFVVCDEVSHWAKRDLWDSLLSSAAKRSSCMFVVITNAGLQDDWAWELREAVRVDPAWYFSRLDGPQASWISPAILDEQRRLLPSIAFQRLWLNRWTSGGGDAISPEVIDFAFRPGLYPITSGAEAFGCEFVGGLDLGVSRDASAFVILGVRRSHDGHGTIRLAHVKVWRPSPGNKVSLPDVESWLAEAHRRFSLKSLAYDPWQAQHLASRLQSGGVGVFDRDLGKLHTSATRVPMVEVAPTGQNLQRQASVLIEAFNDQRIELFENADLRRDLTRFRIEERSYGFRLVSPRDEHGHGDCGSAFALAMLAASELAAKRIHSAGATGPGETVTGRRVTLNEMNHAAQQRALSAFEEEARICHERIQEMRDFPAFEDHPLYKAWRRMGSDRVV